MATALHFPERLASSTSRHAGTCSQRGASQPGRLSIICMGRNDGASGKKRRGSGSGNNRRRSTVPEPATDSGLWYKQDQDLTTPSSGSRGPRQSQTQGATRSTWERSGSSSNRGNARSGRRSRGDDDDDDEDTRGWWERPEERSLQAYAAPRLEPWQEERLQLAYASGRRKAQIQELAREVDLDRSVVIAWFKEFALKPQAERDAILTARRTDEEARRAEKASRDAVEAATGQASNDARIAAAAKPDQETPTGFIPFYLRKQLGVDKQKRISGEVLRTLESIYDRTPFPSADVIRGLYELHRLSREVALEWFAARREADGISSSTHKRTGRESLRQKDRNLEGAFAGSDGPRDGPRRAAGPGPESPGMLSLLGQLPPGAQAGADQQQPEEPTVVTLSRQELAALRSSLPSPNKHKGRQMAEKMGIKTGADTASTQIGNVQYVAEVPDEETRGGQVRASWRFRAAAGEGRAGGSARRVRLRGRRAARDASDSAMGEADE